MLSIFDGPKFCGDHADVHSRREHHNVRKHVKGSTQDLGSRDRRLRASRVRPSLAAGVADAAGRRGHPGPRQAVAVLEVVERGLGAVAMPRVRPVLGPREPNRHNRNRCQVGAHEQRVVPPQPNPSRDSRDVQHKVDEANVREAVGRHVPAANRRPGTKRKAAINGVRKQGHAKKHECPDCKFGGDDPRPRRRGPNHRQRGADSKR